MANLANRSETDHLIWTFLSTENYTDCLKESQEFYKKYP